MAVFLYCDHVKLEIFFSRFCSRQNWHSQILRFSNNSADATSMKIEAQLLPIHIDSETVYNCIKMWRSSDVVGYPAVIEATSPSPVCLGRASFRY